MEKREKSKRKKNSTRSRNIKKITNQDFYNYTINENIYLTKEGNIRIISD
jgi:hypothetical protein